MSRHAEAAASRNADEAPGVERLERRVPRRHGAHHAGDGARQGRDPSAAKIARQAGTWWARPSDVGGAATILRPRESVRSCQGDRHHDEASKTAALATSRCRRSIAWSICPGAWTRRRRVRVDRRPAREGLATWRPSRRRRTCSGPRAGAAVWCRSEEEDPVHRLTNRKPMVERGHLNTRGGPCPRSFALPAGHRSGLRSSCPGILAAFAQGPVAPPPNSSATSSTAPLDAIAAPTRRAGPGRPPFRARSCLCRRTPRRRCSDKLAKKDFRDVYRPERGGCRRHQDFRLDQPPPTIGMAGDNRRQLGTSQQDYDLRRDWKGEGGRWQGVHRRRPLRDSDAMEGAKSRLVPACRAVEPDNINSSYTTRSGAWPTVEHRLHGGGQWFEPLAPALDSTDCCSFTAADESNGRPVPESASSDPFGPFHLGDSTNDRPPNVPGRDGRPARDALADSVQRVGVQLYTVRTPAREGLRRDDREHRSAFG